LCISPTRACMHSCMHVCHARVDTSTCMKYECSHCSSAFTAVCPRCRQSDGCSLVLAGWGTVGRGRCAVKDKGLSCVRAWRVLWPVVSCAQGHRNCLLPHFDNSKCDVHSRRTSDPPALGPPGTVTPRGYSSDRRRGHLKSNGRLSFALLPLRLEPCGGQRALALLFPSLTQVSSLGRLQCSCVVCLSRIVIPPPLTQPLTPPPPPAAAANNNNNHSPNDLPVRHLWGVVP
jgi:hypothetical protein